MATRIFDIDRGWKRLTNRLGKTPKVEVRVRRLGLRLQSPAEEFPGLRQLAALAKEHSQKTQGVVLERLLLQDRTIQRFGFPQAACLMMGQGRPQRLGPI